MSGYGHAVEEISSQAELQALCSGHQGVTAVLLWAPWHPPSVQLTKVFEGVAADQKTVKFGKVNTDVCGTIATSVDADQVPFVAFLDPKGNKLDALTGFDPPKLVEKVKLLASRPVDACAGAGAGPEDLNAKLKRLINFSPVMLFMKGSKIEPFCQFSKQAVALMEKHEAEYSTFDILGDQEVREGLKDYSNWKTFPQLYIQGELIGGVDIMKEMDEDGSFKEALAIGSSETEAATSLEDRLKALVNKGEVTLFMKGDPDAPKCGFSRKMCELLKLKNVKFETFDILSDQEVREGLKTYSNWRTYPQLYSHGKLVGGLDIVQEMAEEGVLFEELGIEQTSNL